MTRYPDFVSNSKDGRGWRRSGVRRGIPFCEGKAGCCVVSRLQGTAGVRSRGCGFLKGRKKGMVRVKERSGVFFDGGEGNSGVLKQRDLS